MLRPTLVIKKGVLLLIAQHDRWLAQDADVQSGALCAGVGKDDLMRKGGLAAARPSGYEVGCLGMPPPSTSSDPGTPEGILWMETLSLMTSF